MMKIEEIELMKITKTDVKTSEDEKTNYTAIFDNKDEGIRVSVTQDKKFDLSIGQKYTIKIDTEQKKLT